MKKNRVVLPKDSFPHKSVIEWWYFNGNLFDKDNNRYSFMNCLFKANPKKTDIPLVSRIPVKKVYFSHSMFADIKNKEYTFHAHPLSIISNDSFTKKNLFINYMSPSLEGYINNEIVEIGKSKYKIKNDNVDLTLVSNKKPFMHCGKGYFVVKGKKVYYYSLSNMSAIGTVQINGKQIKVKGKVWMDHQWAGFIDVKLWNWFSIQLDNDTDLMVMDYNNGEKIYAGINDKNQKSEFTNDVILTPQKIWGSSLTGAKYPVAWKISIPSRKINLDVKVPLPNQEILFGSLNYWEGPIDISGKIRNKKVKGYGFMELTGRKMKKSNISIYEHELREQAGHYINLAKKEVSAVWKNYWKK